MGDLPPEEDAAGGALTSGVGGDTTSDTLLVTYERRWTAADVSWSLVRRHSPQLPRFHRFRRYPLVSRAGGKPRQRECRKPHLCCLGRDAPSATAWPARPRCDPRPRHLRRKKNRGDASDPPARAARFASRRTPEIRLRTDGVVVNRRRGCCLPAVGTHPQLQPSPLARTVSSPRASSAYPPQPPCACA